MSLMPEPSFGTHKIHFIPHNENDLTFLENWLWDQIRASKHWHLLSEGVFNKTPKVKREKYYHLYMPKLGEWGAAGGVECIEMQVKDNVLLDSHRLDEIIRAVPTHRCQAVVWSTESRSVMGELRNNSLSVYVAFDDVMVTAAEAEQKENSFIQIDPPSGVTDCPIP